MSVRETHLERLHYEQDRSFESFQEETHYDEAVKKLNLLEKSIRIILYLVKGRRWSSQKSRQNTLFSGI